MGDGGADREGSATLFGGRLVLRQAPNGHRAGTDAVLLAAAADPRAGERFVDVGAGVGTVGLWLGLREHAARGVLLETDPAAAEFARGNVEANGLQTRVEVAGLDLFDREACRRAGLEGAADLVVTNPPFYRAGTVRVSPDPGRMQAHVVRNIDADPHAAWIRRCADLLTPRGRLLAIHRPDAVPSLLDGLRGRVGGMVLVPIHPKSGRPAVRVLLGGIAGSRAPLTLRPGLVLHGPDGAFTAEAQAIHLGQPIDIWPAALRRPRPRSGVADEASISRGVTASAAAP